MNSRQRFLATLRCQAVDHPPLFEEGFREEALAAWQAQGLPSGAELSRLFHYDRRDEIDPDLYPRPDLERWPTRREDLAGNLEQLRRRLNPQDAKRLPPDWRKQVRAWRGRDFPVLLRIHQGFFLSLGVDGWQRFNQVMQLVMDDPTYVQEALRIQGEFNAAVAEMILQQVEIDAAIFSEPIGGMHGPLISPQMYTRFAIESYRPALKAFKQHGVDLLIWRTYANTRRLLPAALEAGFNVLWACECELPAMDYQALRREFGRDLRLIGGIDTDLLRSDPESIQREMQASLPPLLAQGGFIPLADGRVREDVPYENYRFYRRLLEQMTGAG